MLIRTEKSEAIMSFLKRRFLVNENIIGIIENLPEAEIYVDNVENPTGVLVNKDGYMHYVYTEDDRFIDNMCDNYLKEGFYGFSGVEGELAEKIRSRYLLGWESPCTLYYLPKENFDISLKKNDTQPIKVEDAETVDHFYQYRHPGTLDIIRRDITKRPTSSIYVNGEIACWVLIHDDNSMGIMYTKEEHRRKGYAVDVTIDLINKVLDAGKIPYIQIVKGNGMSPGLAKKCGFVEAGRADWFGIIVGTPKELTEANETSRDKFLKSMPEALRNAVYDKNAIYKGLFNFLHSFKYNDYNRDGLSFVKVENQKQREDWCGITSYCLKGNIDRLASRAALSELADNPDFNLYVMYSGDSAVAASTTHRFDEEDKGIYLLSIIPEHRDSILLEILVNETIQAEKNNGFGFIVTQAEEGLVDIYKELWFRESHTVQL